MKVPFLDLKAQHAAIGSEVAQAVDQVIQAGAFAGGPAVEAFERAYARHCQCEHAVGVGSGTEALWLTLLALGVGPGDEVITAANTFIATAEAISFAGARPVFVDVEQASFNMDPEQLEAAITPRTKAVIPVHLYGQPADMDRIVQIARRRGLFIVEDASQAHGALYNGRAAGSIGHAGCFSFYPGKNLGAYGEAGAIVTQDAKLASSLRRLRDHGQGKKYYHDAIGWNARMDGIQGAVLGIKLGHLPAWTQARRDRARHYDRLLSAIEGVAVPRQMPYARHVYHIYAIRLSGRDELAVWLKDRDIHTGIHYPVPIHLQKAYRALGLKEGAYPVAEQCAREILSLPMFAELTDEQISAVAAEIEEFMRTRMEAGCPNLQAEGS